MANPELKRKRKWSRANFEHITHKHALTVDDIIKMHNKGLIRGDSYLFTLEGVKEIASGSYSGGWANAAEQTNPGSPWSQEVRCADIRKMITEAFTT